MKKGVLIAFTILSALVAIFGYFYIPILSLLGVKFPSRDFLWVLTIIPTVFTFQIPLIICILAFKEK